MSMQTVFRRVIWDRMSGIVVLLYFIGLVVYALFIGKP